LSIIHSNDVFGKLYPLRRSIML